MKATYQFRYTPELLDTMYARYRTHRDHQSPDRFGYFLGVLGFGLLFTLYIHHSRWFGMVLYGLITGFIIPVVRNDLRFRRWRAKKTLPGLPSLTTVLSDEGVVVNAGREVATVPWSLIAAASRFRDGILLDQTPIFRWLPDSALTGARPDEVTDLVRTKVRTFQSLQTDAASGG